MQYNWLTDWGLEKQNDKIQRGQVIFPDRWEVSTTPPL